MAIVKTVKVVDENSTDGFIVVNESDIGHKQKIYKKPQKEVVEEKKEDLQDNKRKK